jgi:hypothetical protein
MSPFFSISDKGRDVAQRVVIFSLLVIFFSGFKIQLTQVPIFNIPLPLQADNPAHSIPTVASIFLIVALFHLLMLVGIYLGEYSSHIELANQGLNRSIFEVSLDTRPPKDQQIAAAINRSSVRNFWVARCGSWIRLVTDLVMPIGLAALACYLELGHSVAAIYQML